MKCARCSTELPGQAQFCLKCGTPVAATPAGATVAVTRPTYPAGSSGSFRKVAAVAGAVAAVALGFLAWKYLNGTRVAETSGKAPEGSRLTDRGGRVPGPSRLTDTSGTVQPAPPNPTDVIDYLKFLKEMERERVSLVKKHEGEMKTLVPLVTAGNLSAEMQGSEADISRGHNDTYAMIQKKMDGLTADWDALAAKFRSRPAPQSCLQLQSNYYDALSQTSSAVIKVGRLFANAMGGMASGDISKVTDIVGQLQSMDGSGMGSPSQAVDTACEKADQELAAVCDRFHIHKDFDIKPDGGGANPIGAGF